MWTFLFRVDHIFWKFGYPKYSNLCSYIKGSATRLLHIGLVRKMGPEISVISYMLGPSKKMGGWYMRMTWGQEVCYASLASALGLSTVWSLLGNPGCQAMSTLHAGYIPQRKVTLASSSGSLGFLMNFHCVWSVVRMVDSVPRWGLSLSRPIQ